MQDNNIVFQRIFNAIDEKSQGYIVKAQVLELLEKNGITNTNPQVVEVVKALGNYSRSDQISFEDFMAMIKPHVSIFERIAKGNLIIPNFKAFADKIRAIYAEVKQNELGEVADYIPQLARVNPDHFAVSIYTVDGQRLSIGDCDTHYCVQSTCKPINYCLALETNGEDLVHNHVGREPSGRRFNEITLNRKNLPHNPMINAGAIMCSSLISPGDGLAERFEHVMSVWQELSGDVRPGYNNSVYHSERETADRNFALAHFMREVGAFPEGTRIQETLDFYFQCCSIEVTANSMATIAATFANGGVCPANGKKVFSANTVKNCLSLMYSCGMYDFSGEFAFSVGLPAKSGVSGALMIVIPNVMGIAVWSPRLDEMGNSVRGVHFAKELVRHFSFHNYDILRGTSEKTNPRLHKTGEDANLMFSFIWAASQGDLDEIKRLLAFGVNVNDYDYDKRSALHLAVAEGHTGVVEYLVRKGANVNAKDRFGNTPLSDAKKAKNAEIINILSSVFTPTLPQP